MTVVLVNGIRTHGAGNVDRLMPRLESRGHRVIDVALPKRGHLSARWKANALLDAQIIYQATEGEGGDLHVVAHSYGCWRALLSAERRRFKSLWLFRPALSRNYNLAQIPNAPRVYCFHSKGDMAVRIGSWLPFHPFGRAGTHGMTDPAVMNIQSYGSHAKDFAEPLISQWERLISENI